MGTLLRSVLVWLFWCGVATAQVAGAGYVPPLSVCQGFYFVYNMAAGTATCTRYQNGVVNGTCGSGATLSSTLVSGGTTTQNNNGLIAFATAAQEEIRPAVTSWYNGGYTHQTLANSTSSGNGTTFADTAANNCIEMDIPAGTFQYTDNTWPAAIPWLRVVGAGGISQKTNMENTLSSGGSYLQIPFWPNSDYYHVGASGNPAYYAYFTNSITAGATSATLKGAAANASNYYPGAWALLFGRAQQYPGTTCGSSSYPPNVQYYEWVKVTAANASTGVLSFDRPTLYSYSANWPYSGTLTDGPTGTCDPVRLITIDSPTWPATQWMDVEGIHFIANPNFSPVTANEFQLVGAIDGYVTDVFSDDAAGFSMMRNWQINNSMWNFDEADKTINSLIYNSDYIGIQANPSLCLATSPGCGTFNHASELNWTTNGGVILSYGNAAETNIGAKNVILNNTTFNGLIATPLAGFNGSISMNDNWWTVGVSVNRGIFVGTNQGTNAPPFTAFPLSQATSSGSPGYLTIDNSTTLFICNGTNCPLGPNGAATRLGTAEPNGTNYGESISDNWGVGNQIYMAASTPPTLLTGCFVTNITGDTTNIYVDITAGCTLVASDVIWSSKPSTLTVLNTQGINTGFANWVNPTLTTDGIIHYPNGHPAIPTITWTNNSGN